MRRFLSVIGVCLFLAGLTCLSQAQFNSFPPGTFAGRAARDAAGGGGCTYTGPGDVVSGALAAWGFEAYTAATCGAKAVNVCNVADVVCADLSTSATTGQLVVSTIGGSSCSIVTCTIKTFYDLTGNGKDQTQATIGNRAVLTVSAQNGVACGTFASASSQSYHVAMSQALPVTYSSVAKRTSNFTVTQAILASAGPGEVALAFPAAANQMFLYNGTVFSASATDSAFHAAQGVFAASGNSTLRIDGSATTGNAGNSSNVTGNFYIGGDEAVPSNYLDGVFCEGLLYGIGFSGTQQTNMDTNQRSSGRWNF